MANAVPVKCGILPPHSPQKGEELAINKKIRVIREIRGDNLFKNINSSLQNSVLKLIVRVVERQVVFAAAEAEHRARTDT